MAASRAKLRRAALAGQACGNQLVAHTADAEEINLRLRRPDLVYNDGLPYQAFEIKPDGSEAAGEAQLGRYLKTAGSQSIAGNSDLIFQGASSLTVNGGWFGTDYTYSPSDRQRAR